MTTSYTISPTPTVSDAIEVDVDASTVTIYSTDSTFGILNGSAPVTYTVTIFQVTEGGINYDTEDEQMQFTVVVTEAEESTEDTVVEESTEDTMVEESE